MNLKKYTIIILLLLLNSCITEFIPKTNETKEFLVVEGLVTDQHGPNTIKLSRSFPLGTKNTSNPVTGSNVTISDDLNNVYDLKETDAGTYITDSSEFRGKVGRTYTLHIRTHPSSSGYNYESLPAQMIPVPPIDSVFYSKVTIEEGPDGTPSQEGCQVYLNAHDPNSLCKFYRWEYTETWEFHIPFPVPNRICWLSTNSDVINVKSTVALSSDKISMYPLNYISNTTDKLSVEYSILVNQYSLNEDEYQYWEKLQNMTEQVGGLYDRIPSAVPSNVYSLDDPDEKVQGYFSVSASSSKRIFIKDHFAGLVNQYSADKCVADTLWGSAPPQIPNPIYWILYSSIMPPYSLITYSKGCYDCTVRGTNIPPDFWNNK
jgi:Domain of unknown function (DUF4249)